MFSSGLFESCCSRDWDSASFCTPASLKGTHVLHTQTCHCSRKLQLVGGGMLEGVKTQLALGQTRKAGTALGPKPVALKGVPCYSLSSERDSPLLAETQGVLLPAQGRHSSPALTSPAAPWTRGVVDWDGENRGNVWGCGGLGSDSSLPAMSLAMCHLSVPCLSKSPSHRPSPPCSLWEGPTCGLGEKMHRVLFSGGIQIPSSPQRPHCSWVRARQVSRCNLPVSLSLFLPRWCGGESSCLWAICSRGARQCQAPARRPPHPPPAPPRVLRITSAVSSRGICRHRRCHPHASLPGTGSICCLT